ncbi:MAG: hypothetical protein WCP12_04520 [bacterium]
MLTRGSYGIEYDHGNRDNAYHRYWWIALFIPIVVSGLLFSRGCSSTKASLDDDPVQAQHFDVPAEKTTQKRLSIWTHFAGNWSKKPNSETNKPVTTASVQSSGTSTKQMGHEVREWFDKANMAEQGNNLIEARQILMRLLRMDTAFELRPFIERKLGALHASLYLSTRPAPGKVIHRLASGEKIGKLAADYGCTLEYIVYVNAIQKPETLQIGKMLTVLQNPRFELMISKRDSTAVLLLNNGFFKRYTLLLSDGNPPPKGLYQVRSRGKKTIAEEAAWSGMTDDKPRHERDICWVILATENGAMLGGISLQGTQNTQTKHALNIRFRNSDIEELYFLLPASTPVIVAD